MRDFDCELIHIVNSRTLRALTSMRACTGHRQSSMSAIEDCYSSNVDLGSMVAHQLRRAIQCPLPFVCASPCLAALPHRRALQPGAPGDSDCGEDASSVSRRGVRDQWTQTHLLHPLGLHITLLATSLAGQNLGHRRLSRLPCLRLLALFQPLLGCLFALYFPR
jgi:hypothetical protein